MHYQVTGHGQDILLIHGWASSSAMWAPLVHVLQDHLRCWSVDLLGFGESPRPEDAPSLDIDVHTTQLIAFCEHHAIHPRAVIGHSMGGMLTLKLALARPDIMDRLVLIAPVVTGRFGTGVDLGRLVASDVGTYAIERSSVIWRLVQSDIVDLLAPLLTRPGLADDHSLARIRRDVKRSSWQAAAHGIRSIARENLEPRLASIQHPALVIIGSRDQTVPPEEGRLAAERLPHAQLLELSGLSHQVLDDSPRRVCRAIDHFLHESNASVL